MSNCEECIVKTRAVVGPVGPSDVDVLNVWGRQGWAQNARCLGCIGRKKVNLLHQMGRQRASGQQASMSPKERDRFRGKRISKKRGAGKRSRR